MSDSIATMKTWVETWAAAGEALQELKVREMRLSDTYSSMVALSDAFDAATADTPPAPMTGLMEQQRLFQMLSKKCST